MDVEMKDVNCKKINSHIATKDEDHQLTQLKVVPSGEGSFLKVSVTGTCFRPLYKSHCYGLGL